MFGSESLDSHYGYDYIILVKKVYYLLFFLLSLGCTPKRDVLYSVPVLMDYELFYPDEALERGLEGRVLMSMLVTELGKVENVRIYESSGNSLLDSAAVRTAQTFTFAPAMLRNKPVKASVLMPVEFQLKDIDLETWLMQVMILHKKLEHSFDKKNIEELYHFYKRLIYSTRFESDLGINDYIKEAVLEKTGRLWDGYWSLYPASSLLFIDIMNRYPDSFLSLRAEADFKKFLKKESIRIRHTLSASKSDTIINRLYSVIK
jgi:TonB family protein